MATIPIFDGSNYEFWRVKMETLFLSMDLLDTVKNGFHGDTTEEQKQKDAKALSHIQRGVSDQIFPEIKGAEKAKEAWDILSGLNIENVIIPTDLRRTGENHLIVATLIATVAFTAAFTMPGGYNGNDGPNQGMAILTREAAFKAFMITDAVAVSLSFSAVLIHFYVAIIDNRDEVKKLVYMAAYLLFYAAMAMVLAFVTGTYAVLAHSSGLAISVCVIGCLSLSVFSNTDILDKVSHPIESRVRKRLYRYVNAVRSLFGSEPRGGEHQEEPH